MLKLERLKTLKKLQLTSLIFFIFLTFSMITFAEDKIVAVVNNEIITQKDLDDFMNFMYLQLSAKYKDKELEDKLNVMKPDLLNRLIEDKLILQQGKKENIPIDETKVKARIKEIRSHYPSDAEFQNALIQQGLTQADIELKLREQSLIFNMIDSKIRNKIIINPAAVTDFYERNAQDFVEPESRKVSSLIIKDEALVSMALDYIKQGNNFDKISKDLSLELNNLGQVKKGQLIKEIEDVIFSLGAGGVSKAIKLNDLYYIFKIDEIVPERQYTLAQVQDEIYNRLFELKMQKELVKWLDELKEKSYVEIK